MVGSVKYLVNLKLVNMKKIISYIYIFCAPVLFTSCTSDNDSEGLSAVTNYATFEYEELVVVPLGGTFTPSATASEDGNSLEVNSSGTVNTEVVGIYDITYSATNSDGFDANVFQTVVVHDPTIIGTDVSGAIRDTSRNERTGVISLIEGTTSIFLASDFGFGGTFPVYFQMDGDMISEIPQNYIFGATSVDLTYDPVSKKFTTLINPQGFSYEFEYQN